VERTHAHVVRYIRAPRPSVRPPSLHLGHAEGIRSRKSIAAVVRARQTRGRSLSRYVRYAVRAVRDDREIGNGFPDFVRFRAFVENKRLESCARLLSRVASPFSCGRRRDTGCEKSRKSVVAVYTMTSFFLLLSVNAFPVSVYIWTFLFPINQKNFKNTPWKPHENESQSTTNIQFRPGAVFVATTIVDDRCKLTSVTVTDVRRKRTARKHLSRVVADRFVRTQTIAKNDTKVRRRGINYNELSPSLCKFEQTVLFLDSKKRLKKTIRENHVKTSPRVRQIFNSDPVRCPSPLRDGDSKSAFLSRRARTRTHDCGRGPEATRKRSRTRTVVFSSTRKRALFRSRVRVGVCTFCSVFLFEKLLFRRQNRDLHARRRTAGGRAVRNLARYFLRVDSEFRCTLPQQYRNTAPLRRAQILRAGRSRRREHRGKFVASRYAKTIFAIRAFPRNRIILGQEKWTIRLIYFKYYRNRILLRKRFNVLPRHR